MLPSFAGDADDASNVSGHPVILSAPAAETNGLEDMESRMHSEFDAQMVEIHAGIVKTSSRLKRPAYLQACRHDSPARDATRSRGYPGSYK